MWRCHTPPVHCVQSTKYKRIQNRQRRDTFSPRTGVMTSQLRTARLRLSVCWPYRSVEVALTVHGDVEPRLGALDGHYPESHRNQVELHCKKKKRGKSGVRVIILFLNVHSSSSWHKKTIAFQLSPISASPPYSISVKGRERRCLLKKKKKGKEGEAAAD